MIGGILGNFSVPFCLFVFIISILVLKKSHGSRNGWGEYNLSQLVAWFKPVPKSSWTFSLRLRRQTHGLL